MRKRRRLKSLLVGASVALVLLAAGEGLARLIPRDRPVRERQQDRMFNPDRLLGYRLIRDNTVRAAQAWDGKPIFDTVYTTDECGRRTSLTASFEPRPSHALFFGDSVTFGYGVLDHESVASQIGLRTSDYRPYNLAAPGWGPQHSLALLEETDLRAEVGERGGFALYTLIDAHIRRCMGSMREMQGWGRLGPYYELDGEGVARHRGNFVEGRPLTTFVYRVLDESRALQHLEIEIPPLGERHYELCAAVLARCRDLYREKFGSERFYVVLFPGMRRAARARPHLEARGLNVLDYSERSPANGKWKLDGDGHPNAAANAEIAGWLIADLGLAAR